MRQCVVNCAITTTIGPVRHWPSAQPDQSTSEIPATTTLTKSSIAGSSAGWLGSTGMRLNSACLAASNGVKTSDAKWPAKTANTVNGRMVSIRVNISCKLIVLAEGDSLCYRALCESYSVSLILLSVVRRMVRILRRTIGRNFG